MPSMLEFFQNDLRQPLFTGFLTASGFLFSVKAFLITNLYREIYATNEYRNHVKSMHKIDKRVKLTSPLASLQVRLLYCIGATLLVSVTQLTVGFLPYDWVPYVCYGFAVIGFIAIGYAMWTVRYSMVSWFAYLEKTYGPESVKDDPPQETLRDGESVATLQETNDTPPAIPATKKARAKKNGQS